VKKLAIVLLGVALNAPAIIAAPTPPKSQLKNDPIPMLEPLRPGSSNAPRTYDSGNVRSFDVAVSRVEANTNLPTTLAPGTGTVFLDPRSEMSASVFTANDIYDSNNSLAIPRGSEVRGRFVPVRGGLKFQGDTVVVRGQYYTIQASSDILYDEKDPREYSTGALAGDAALGAGVGALLGALTGGVTWGGILGGAAASSLIGNVTAPQVVVVNPDRALNVRLDAPLTLKR
jgi:hypothetical protein